MLKSKSKPEISVELDASTAVTSRRVVLRDNKTLDVDVIDNHKPISGRIRIKPQKTETINCVNVSFYGVLELIEDYSNSKQFEHRTRQLELTSLEKGEEVEIPFTLDAPEVEYESYYGIKAQVHHYLHVQVMRKKRFYEYKKDVYVINGAAAPAMPLKDKGISEEISCQDKTLQLNIRISNSVIHLAKGDILHGTVTFLVAARKIRNMTISLVCDEGCIGLDEFNKERELCCCEIMEGTPAVELTNIATNMNSDIRRRDTPVPFYINTSELDLVPSFHVPGLLSVHYALVISINCANGMSNYKKFPIVVTRL